MNTDIKDLFKNVKVKDPVIVGAVATFVVALVLTIVIVPMFVSSVQRNQELLAETEAASQALAEIESIQAAQPAALRGRIVQAREQLTTLLADFPSTSAAAQELSAYYGYANNLSAQLVRMEAILNTPEEDAATAFKVQRFLLEVQGDVPSIVRFWAQIGSGPFKTFLLDNLVIMPEMTPVGQADLTVYSSDLVLGLDLPSAPQPQGTLSPTVEVTQEQGAPAQTPEATPMSAGPTPAGKAPALTYRVRPGDSLALIAERYGVSVNELVSANRLRSTSVFIDQRLVIPVR
jgi:hypothetical protein